MEEGKSYYRVIVYAEDEATRTGQWGTAVEPKHLEKRDGSTVWDKFALTKALNKAQRNAMKALLPLEFIETVKAQFLGDKTKMREIQAGPGAERLAEMPPPLDDERMRNLQAVVRDKYVELKELNRARLVPSAFDAYMARSAHSHERMQDFIDHVDELLEDERSKASS